ncbi:hypothetical protein SCHPADRAFT_947296 [Schizopora paradoxa]|uniref:Uncharacterized protein n=1 Tax=Schizopora paradoxa TaxID=27342 RepID=A0A0H2R6A5_9AGAM|nr:hypothetical protein SCHPADRAFT_947296 [Schizopora paradoxa]
MFFVSDSDESSIDNTESVVRSLGLGRPAGTAEGLEFERRNYELYDKYEKVLPSDPKSVIKLAEECELMALAAILNNMSKMPVGLYPEIFRVCCTHVNYKKLNEVMSTKSDAATSHPQLPDLSAKTKSPELINRLAVTSLWVLGSQKMRSAVSEKKDSFTKLFAEYQEDILSAMILLYEAHRAERLGMPNSKLGLSSLPILLKAMSNYGLERRRSS